MKFLAIDDEPAVLKQIEKAVREASGPDGKPYEVVALTDHREAIKRLEAEAFDVVITDMVMGTEEKEGLNVLRELTGKSPITIVLTAYPSIPNCVASMRVGAWDYLEKVPANQSDPYKNLLKSLEEACRQRLENPEKARSSLDARWVRDHLAELMDNYPGEVIAVLDQQVVDHGPDYATVAERVKKNHPVAQAVLVSVLDAKVEAVE